MGYWCLNTVAKDGWGCGSPRKPFPASRALVSTGRGLIAANWLKGMPVQYYSDNTLRGCRYSSARARCAVDSPRPHSIIRPGETARARPSLH